MRRSVGEFFRDMASKLTAELGSLGAMQTIAAVSVGGDACDVEVREMTAVNMAVDITGCRYAEFFQQIGEPELGFLLACSADFPMAEGIPGVELERTQTIMQGADFCDFRYRFLPDEGAPPATRAPVTGGQAECTAIGRAMHDRKGWSLTRDTAYTFRVMKERPDFDVAPSSFHHRLDCFVDRGRHDT